VSIELRRKLSIDEIEQICNAAEEAARKHLLSKISPKRISDISIVVEASGSKPLTLNVEVSLSTPIPSFDIDKLVSEANSAAFEAAEAKVRELKLCIDTKD